VGGGARRQRGGGRRHMVGQRRRLVLVLLVVERLLLLLELAGRQVVPVALPHARILSPLHIARRSRRQSSRGSDAEAEANSDRRGGQQRRPGRWRRGKGGGAGGGRAWRGAVSWRKHDKEEKEAGGGASPVVLPAPNLCRRLLR
jgi:hypothetical protein